MPAVSITFMYCFIKSCSSIYTPLTKILADSLAFTVIFSMSPPLFQDTVNSVLALLDSGYSCRKIHASLGISISSISEMRSAHRPDLEKSTADCPRKLDPIATHHAVRLVTSHNSVSTCQATQTLCELTNPSISPKTVRGELKDAGMRPVKKVKKPRHTNVKYKSGLLLLRLTSTGLWRTGNRFCGQMRLKSTC